MVKHLDSLIEKDGTLAKLAGVASAALFSLIASGLIPADHIETAAVVAGMLATFAHAAMRRNVLAKRREPNESENETI